MAGTEEDPIDLLAEAFPDASGPDASLQADLTILPVGPPLQTLSDLVTATIPDQPGSSKDPHWHFLKKPAKLKPALQLMISPPKQTVLPPAPLPFPCFADI